MRTDAKIGFAIGAVLLAVLTVYAIVVPKHSKKPTSPVSLVPNTSPPETTSSSGTTTPPIAAADNGATPTPTPTPVPAKDPVKDPVTADPGTVINNGNNIADNGGNGGSGFHPLVTDPAKADDHKPHLENDVYTPANHHDVIASRHATPALPDQVDPTPTGDRVYTIKSGQTLSKIAYEVYGNSRFWVAIQRENKGLNPNNLKVGTQINLPDVSPEQPVVVGDDEALTPPASPTPARTRVVTPTSVVTDAHSYIVKSGDSLYGIAKRILGSGRKADALYALNKDLIGPDKAKLKLGMVLKLPEAAPIVAGAVR